MTPRISSFPPAPSRRRGFALLITITLLAFLVLLLVSLASLTRVETQVASNNQQLAAARQNALMALNIAIGQLQKTVGPDQRTTVRADLADPANVNGFATVPTVGTARWISAWGNANAGDYTLKPSQIESQLSNAGSVNKPVLLNWLVSGNETVSITSIANGSITTPAYPTAYPAPVATIPFQPSQTTVSNAVLGAATALTSGTTLTINTKPAVLLVGPNSVTATNAFYAAKTTSGADYFDSDYVVAPLVDIQAPAGTVPGLAAATTIGRYAYWVGDENTKARANLADNYLQQTSPADQQLNTVYSAFVAQHTGIGFMDSKGGGYTQSIIGLDGKPSPSVGDTKDYIIGTDFNYNNYDSNNVSLNGSLQDANLSGGPSGHLYTTDAKKLIQPTQLPLIGQVSASRPTYTANTASNLQTALKNRWHDISLTSSSVLADTYAGGLKKDVSAALAPNWSAPNSHETADTAALFPPETTSDYDASNPSQWSAVPNWGLLRSYFKQRDNGASVPNGIVLISKPTTTNMGFYPTMVYASMGFSVYADSTGQLYAAIYPFVGLNNPYNAILKTPPGKGNDQVGFRFRNPVGDLTLRIDVNGAPVGTIDLVQLQGGQNQYFRFKLATNTAQNGAQTGEIRAGYIAKFHPTTNTAPYNATGDNEMHYSPDTNTGITDQSHCVTVPLSGLVLTPAQITAAATSFSLTYTGTAQGELDVVYASSNGSGVPSPALDLTPPPNSATNPDPDVWWHAIQHCVFTPPSGGNTTLKQAPLTMNAPDTVPYLVVGTSITLSSTKNLGYDSAIALRPFAQSNGFRARLASRSKFDTWSNGSTRNQGNNIFSCYMEKNTATSIPTSGETSLVKMQTPNIYQRSFASYFFVGYDTSAPNIIYDIPRDDIPLLSLGQFQNASLSLFSTYPAFAFGNSLADVRIAGNTSFAVSSLAKPGSNAGLISGATFGDTYYDLSWHLNRALWDKYFVSGIPTGSASGSPTPTAAWTQSDIDSGKPLPNARFQYYKPSSTALVASALVGGSSSNSAYDLAAANLMLAGGFNINSTSEQAWRATLGGTYNVPYRINSGDTTTPVQDIQVHRTVSLGKWYLNWTVFNQGPGGNSRQTRGPAGGDRYLSPYSGYGAGDYTPVNNPVQTQTLPYLVARIAQAIVKEVKIRGPFLSMGDFANRRLTDTSLTTFTGKTGLNGALQNALNTDTSVTANIPAYSPRFPTALVGRNLSPNPNSEYSGAPPGAKPTGSQWILNHMRAGATTNQSYLSSWMAGSGQTVTQADLLSTFGPGMVARSDTFTIRTYGEALDPVNSTSANPVILGRAWCEAVVQRLPAYVDQTDGSLGSLGNATPPASTNSTNQKFGRRFVVISFKWLSPTDI